MLKIQKRKFCVPGFVSHKTRYQRGKTDYNLPTYLPTYLMLNSKSIGQLLAQPRYLVYEFNTYLPRDLPLKGVVQSKGGNLALVPHFKHGNLQKTVPSERIMTDPSAAYYYLGSLAGSCLYGWRAPFKMHPVQIDNVAVDRLGLSDPFWVARDLL